MLSQGRKSFFCFPAVIGGFFIYSPATLSQEDRRLKVGGSVGVEYGNDSNVVVDEIDLATSTSDQFLRLKARGSADYNLTQQHSVSTSLSFNDKRYSDADSFDLQTLLFSAGYKYKSDGATFAINYRKADAELGGNDFLSLVQMSPSVSFFINKKNFFRIAYTYIEKEIENNPLRDADSHEFGVDYYYFWNGLNDYFITSIKYRKAEAVDEVFSFSGYQLRGVYKKRHSLFDYQSRVTFEVKFRERDYNDVINTTIDDFRLDQQQTLGVGHETDMTENLKLLFDVSHINNSSNLDTLDYHETIASAGIEYRF